MRIIFLTLGLLLLFSCSDRGKSAYTVTPATALATPKGTIPKFTDLWHLGVMPSYGGGRTFNPGEVTLKVDTLAKVLEVGGILNNIFTAKGKYSYKISDTTFTSQGLRGSYSTTTPHLKLSGINTGTIFYTFDSSRNKIRLVWDFSVNIVDEEGYYYFGQ